MSVLCCYPGPNTFPLLNLSLSFNHLLYKSIFLFSLHYIWSPSCCGVPIKRHSTSIRTKMLRKIFKKFICILSDVLSIYQFINSYQSINKLTSSINQSINQLISSINPSNVRLSLKEPGVGGTIIAPPPKKKTFTLKILYFQTYSNKGRLLLARVLGQKMFSDAWGLPERHNYKS